MTDVELPTSMCICGLFFSRAPESMCSPSPELLPSPSTFSFSIRTAICAKHSNSSQACAAWAQSSSARRVLNVRIRESVRQERKS